MALLGSGIPMFKLRPSRAFLFAALLVLVIGGLVTAYFFAEDRSGGENHAWVFALLLTLLLVFLLVIVAFARYAFGHLRHHRPGYKRG